MFIKKFIDYFPLVFVNKGFLTCNSRMSCRSACCPPPLHLVGFLSILLTSSSASGCPFLSIWLPSPLHLVDFFLCTWLSSSSAFSWAFGCLLPHYLVYLFLSIWLPSSSALWLPSSSALWLPSSSSSKCPLPQHLATLFLSICSPCFSDSIALFISIWLPSSSPSNCPPTQHLFALFLSIYLPSSSLKVHKHAIFFLTFFAETETRNLTVPRACNMRFLKIVFDSAEIFDF